MKTKSDYYTYLRSEIRQFLPESYSLVLEIGCAEGKFIRNLKQGCETWGVEMNREAALVAQQRFTKVLVGSYDEVSQNIPDEYFDLIICNDIIEHLPDSTSFLSSLSKKLKTSGSIVGSIPNVRYVGNLYNILIKKDWQYESSGILDRTHLRFFTHKSIVRTLTDQGLTIAFLKGINAQKNPLKRLLVLILVLSTFFHSWDIQYPQFGFRAIKQ